MLYVHRATEREVLHVGAHLRPEDRREVLTATGMEPESAVLASHRDSRLCFSARLGSPLAPPILLFGVSDDSKDARLGGIWLLATPGIKQAWLTVLKETPEWLNMLAAQYPLGVHNAVDVRNILHLRWCLKVGFRVIGNVVINNHDFIQVHYSCVLHRQ